MAKRAAAKSEPEWRELAWSEEELAWPERELAWPERELAWPERELAWWGSELMERGSGTPELERNAAVWPSPLAPAWAWGRRSGRFANRGADQPA